MSGNRERPITHTARQNLLWIDCTAAAIAGMAVLALSQWLSELQGLPRGLLIGIGIVNLLYGSCSFSLAIRARRPLGLIKALVVANGFWACVCLGLGLYFAATATGWGLVQLFGEAAFVGGLACLEWKWRHRLLTPAQT